MLNLFGLYAWGHAIYASVTIGGMSGLSEMVVISIVALPLFLVGLIGVIAVYIADRKKHYRDYSSNFLISKKTLVTTLIITLFSAIIIVVTLLAWNRYYYNKYHNPIKAVNKVQFNNGVYNSTPNI